jgi:hypothetical protein
MFPPAKTPFYINDLPAPPTSAARQDGRPLSADHYWGVYIAGESVARGKDRVNVKKYDPTKDPSGGWGLER